jgi:hypothetical protein
MGTNRSVGWRCFGRGIEGLCPGLGYRNDNGSIVGVDAGRLRVLRELRVLGGLSGLIGSRGFGGFF